jgi:hypothetical protein
MGELKNAYNILGGYFLEKFPLESLRRTWGTTISWSLGK